MKPLLTTLLLACALIAGACSRSDNPAMTAAQATPSPPSEADHGKQAAPAIPPSAPQNESPATMNSGTDATTGPVSGIEVVSSSGEIIAAHVQTDARGAMSVYLPGPGTYLVRYASGPAKGQVLRTINATEAGNVNVSVRMPNAEP